jgi:DNA-directed RNA polymerase subunit RPC12/RpoP
LRNHASQASAAPEGTGDDAGAWISVARAAANRPIPAPFDRDTQVVTSRIHDLPMNILLDCAWCGDEVVFSVDETDDELVCSACNTRMAFAPDPATTFSLLYEPARAA